MKLQCYLMALAATVFVVAFAAGADVESRTLKGHQGSILSVAFSPNGATLASGSRDATIKLWNVQTGKAEKTLTEHKEDVYSVAYSPQGDLAASGSGDKTIKLW